MSIFGKKNTGFTEKQKQEICDIVSLNIEANMNKMSQENQQTNNSYLMEVVKIRDIVDGIRANLKAVNEIRWSLNTILKAISPIIDKESVNAKKELDEIQKRYSESQKKLSDQEKANMLDRLFADVYTEAKSAKYHTFFDSEDDTAYNNLLTKYKVPKGLGSAKPGEQLGHLLAKKVIDYLKNPEAETENGPSPLTVTKEEDRISITEPNDAVKGKKQSKPNRKKAKNGSKPRKNRGKQKAG